MVGGNHTCLNRKHAQGQENPSSTQNNSLDIDAYPLTIMGHIGGTSSC